MLMRCGLAIGLAAGTWAADQSVPKDLGRRIQAGLYHTFEAVGALDRGEALEKVKGRYPSAFAALVDHYEAPKNAGDELGRFHYGFPYPGLANLAKHPEEWDRYWRRIFRTRLLASVCVMASPTRGTALTVLAKTFGDPNMGQWTFWADAADRTWWSMIEPLESWYRGSFRDGDAELLDNGKDSPMVLANSSVGGYGTILLGPVPLHHPGEGTRYRSLGGISDDEFLLLRRILITKLVISGDLPGARADLKLTPPTATSLHISSIWDQVGRVDFKGAIEFSMEDHLQWLVHPSPSVKKISEDAIVQLGVKVLR